MNARKPSAAALLLALLPFVAMCFTVPLWDRIEPVLLGLPFNLFWLICWIILTPLCMWAGVTQFFPGVVLGLYSRRVTAPAVFAGMMIGVVSAVSLMLTHHDPLFGVSAGFLALCLNFLVTIAATLLTRRPT